MVNDLEKGFNDLEVICTQGIENCLSAFPRRDQFAILQFAQML
jgi:hypothetical protein